MPDELSRKVADFASTVPSVEWVEVAQIQRRARRRTMRAAIVASMTVIGVVAVIATVWSGLQPPPPTLIPDVAASATPTTASPTTASPMTRPTIPQLALLQPEDAGPGYEAVQPYIQYPGQMGDAWAMGWDSCPRYAALNITAYRQALVLIGRGLSGGGETIFNDISLYPEGVARQVISDAQRVAQACASFATNSESGDDHEARRTFSVLATGFAGDESVLIGQKITVHEKATGKYVSGYDMATTMALIRRGDHLIKVYLETDNAPLVKRLSTKAADRL